MRPPTDAGAPRPARARLLARALLRTGVILPASALLLLAASPVRAQERDTTATAPGAVAGSVVGLVTDSTSGGALAGATVQLSLRDRLATGFSTTTDATGAFRIDAVPAGVYLAGFYHARLDSLGLEAPTYLVTVGAGETPLMLAVPSPATIVTATCGLPAADSSGMLLGHVRDADGRAPIADARLTVSWPELVLDDRGLRRERRLLTAVTGANGRFALCGIPTDTEVTATVEQGADASGTLVVRVPPRGLLDRDFLLARGQGAVAADTDSVTAAVGGAPRTGTARLAGIVTHADGRPFGNARVALHGSAAADTTRADGRFALGALPAGTHTLEVRAIGYTPQYVMVDLTSGRTDSAVVALDERVATLDEITVYGQRSRSRGRLAEFLERSGRGQGYFITAADIEKRQPFATTDLFRMVPGMRVVPTGSAGYAVVARDCAPTVFLDGVEVAAGAQDLSMLVPPQTIAGIEVYNSAVTTPPQYSRGGCGSILIWTK